MGAGAIRAGVTASNKRQRSLTIRTNIPQRETRALAIACFYALGTAIGGTFAPVLFAWLIQSGSHWRLAGGYILAAVLLALAAVMEWLFGVDAEGKSLESIAAPLSSRGG